MRDYSMKPLTHRDALEFSDGQIVLLTGLFEHQEATVLQLPAQSVTAAERRLRNGSRTSADQSRKSVYAALDWSAVLLLCQILAD